MDHDPSRYEAMFEDAGIDGEVGTGFVGYAMAATHTGVVVTGEDLARAAQQGYHRVRTLTYLE